MGCFFNFFNIYAKLQSIQVSKNLDQVDSFWCLNKNKQKDKTKWNNNNKKTKQKEKNQEVIVF